MGKVIKIGVEGLKQMAAERKARNARKGKGLRQTGAKKQATVKALMPIRDVVFAWDGGICVHALFEKPGTEHAAENICHILPTRHKHGVTEPWNMVAGCRRFNRTEMSGNTANDGTKEYRLEVPSAGSRWRQYVTRLSDGQCFSRLVWKQGDKWWCGPWGRSSWAERG